MDVRGVTLPEILANWLKSTVDALKVVGTYWCTVIPN